MVRNVEFILQSTLRDRCHWCWQYSVLRRSAGEVTLTLVFDSHLHYPTEIDRTLNEATVDKNLQYRVDYDNRPSQVISFILWLGRLGVYTVNLCDFYFYRLIGKLQSGSHPT